MHKFVHSMNILETTIIDNIVLIFTIYYNNTKYKTITKLTIHYVHPLFFFYNLYINHYFHHNIENPSNISYRF